MCGRARVAIARQAYLGRSGIDQARWQGAELFQPLHNAAPGSWIPVLRVSREDGQLGIESMRWGLVPSFHKQGEPFDHWKMFNARSETLHSSPVFRRLLEHRRCVILLNGFYEWKAEAGGRKQPYYIHLPDAAGGGGAAAPAASPAKGPRGAPDDRVVLAVAGLWDAAKDEQGVWMPTATMVTCDACGPLTWLHDRMPVILDTPEKVEAWLGAPLPPNWSFRIDPHAAPTAPAPTAPAQSAVEGTAPPSSSAPPPATATLPAIAASAAAAAAAPAPKPEPDIKRESHPEEEEGPQGTGSSPPPPAPSSSQGHDATSPATSPGGAKRQLSADVLTLISKVCVPYKGSGLGWHPVTSSMTSMGYQAPDACADVRQRKGSISSFFTAVAKPAAGAAGGGKPAPAGGREGARNADACDAEGKGAASGAAGGGGGAGSKRPAAGAGATPASAAKKRPPAAPS